MTNKEMLKGLGTGLISALLFLVFLFIFKMPFLMAIGLGIASYLALMLLFWSKNKLELVINGVSSEEIERTLELARKKVKEIQVYGIKINNYQVKSKVEKICQVAEEILASITKNPQDFKGSKKFFSYYLDTTLKIVKTYADISNQSTMVPEAHATLQKAEGILDNIEETFKKQLAKNLEDDLLDLDAEISLLEKTMKMEGL